ncbi:MAG: choice-of-anchor D domain-containing protein [Candidatus Cloacimonetes bacterium]|nr:choice-of-anchor D domain-containing protein [Candidatus Cloacimonadota bacterium]MCF7868776.1 choice-of-anchor D domain-containing protein [Candidatus Cloacimonadota bacterium]MCF7884206.1 choice-of-anchor D domain-containing protein [Candidatus Cloacimonadota bacterium]
MNSLKIYIFFVVFYLLFNPLFAAFLENVPFEIVQPDGSRYQAFITGDEYYRRVHDNNDYTMLLDRNTGYVVYAIPDGQSIKISSYVVGRVDPASLGITPNLKFHDPDFQKGFDLQQRSNITGRIANIGQANCLVVFVRFSDQTEFPTTTPYQTVEDKFNGIAVSSLRDYYLEISDDQLTLDSFLYPQPTSQGHIVSLINPQPRGYYSPWVQGTNEIGYLEGEGWLRKRELFEWTVIQMNNYVPSGLNIDSDNDGINDALTIIVRGAPDAWGDLLWPTQSYSSDSYGSIHGKAVHNVILNIETALSTNIIIHEMGHLIGAPDFYHYYDSPMAHPPWNQINPVGAWEMMSHNVGHWLTHTKYKYGGWFSNVPTIIPTEELTTYSLSAIDTSPHSCYKIQSSIPDQYYMLEYRRQSGLYETDIPGSGLIVTRVIEGINGNGSGPPDEHYIYRPNGTLTENGQLEIAHLNQQSGRTILINNSETSPWLWADTLSTVPGNIMIQNVGTAGGETITFDVAIENSALRIWSGAVSIDWHNPDNWWTNAVPNIDSEVIIPSGTPNSPVISTNDAYCQNLTIESGACLTISPRTLTVDGNANIYGQLAMTDIDSKLIVNGSLNWRDGSSADISDTAHTAQIDVYRHMNFSAGANVILDRGSVYFKGNQFSTIETMNSACSFNNLYLSKESSTVYLGTEYSTDLTITGQLHNSINCTARAMYENNNINISGYLFPGGIFLMEAGKINFTGNDQKIIVPNYLTDSIDFNDIELNGSLTLDQIYSTGGEININGDLIFSTGTLDAADIDINLGGNWINNVGASAFTPGTGSVIFNGTADQTCNGSSFNILKLNKPSGQLIMSGFRTIQSYDWMQGTITFQSGLTQILDLADNGLYGTWQVTGAVVYIYQDAAQSVDLKGSLIIYDGEVDVNGGSGTSRWPGSGSAYFYMEGGILDFIDQGIFINNDYTFPHAISAGIIKTPYDFLVTRHDFSPTGGSIVIYGNQASEVSVASSSNLGSLFINKSSSSDQISKRKNPSDPMRETAVTLITDLDLVGDLTITNGNFKLNGHTVDVAGNVQIDGMLEMSNSQDQITVTGDVVWDVNSSANVSAGSISLAGDWQFLDGTTAALTSGNTVIFTGNEISEIYISEFDNAAFGNVIINKTDNYITREMLFNSDMKVNGDLTLNDNNVFYAHDTVVQNNFSMNSGSELSLNNGTFNVLGDVDISGHFNVTGGNVYLNQDFTLNADGILTVDNCNFYIDKPYTGNYFTFDGTLNILSGELQISNENVRFTTTPNFGNTGILQLGRGIQATTADAFQPGSGTVQFIGSQWSNIDVDNGNYFHNLYIQKYESLRGCYMNSDLVVNNNLTVSTGKLIGLGNELTVNNDVVINNYGVIDPDDVDVKVGGFWENNRGPAGFVEGTGNVRLIGSTQGGIASDETFYNLILEKSYGSYYYTEIGADKTVQISNNFNIDSGKLTPKANSTLDVNGNLTIAEGTGIRVFDVDTGVNINVAGNFTDNNTSTDDYCGLHLGTSSVTFDGTADQVFAASYSQPEFGNLTIDKTDSHFIPYSNITINGDLFINSGYWSDYASNMSHTFLGDVNISENGWSARYSIVTFGGTEEATYTQAGLCRFNNIIIDKNPSDSGRTAGELTLQSNMRTIWEGDLTIQSGTLNANGNEIGCTGNVTIDGGKLLLNDNSILKVGENKILSVNGSGRLESMGSAGSEATITNYVYNGYHDVYIYTGTIAAEHTIFKRMTTDGVYVSFWGSVDPDHCFHNCTFQDGVSGGYLFRIKNDQDLVVNDAVFPTNSWSSSYNVYKNINQGSVEFINSTGDFSGESHDYDPYDRIDWTTIIPPAISVDPISIDFGNVIVGQTDRDGFHIENTGGQTLTGTITTPDGYEVSYFSGDNTLVRTERNTISYFVEPGNTKSYAVDFTPLLAQSYTGDIIITHNAGGNNKIVQVIGNGIPIPPPDIHISPDSLNFKNVQLGNTKMLSLNFWNAGGSQFTGTISTPLGYTVEEAIYEDSSETGFHSSKQTSLRNDLPIQIGAGEMIDFNVTFAPTLMQNYDGSIIVSGNSGETIYIMCYGDGVDASFTISPYAINKTLTLGTSGTETLTLGNNGNVDIEYLAYIKYDSGLNTIISEDFQGNFPPSGWTLQSLDGWGNWELCDYAGHESSQSAGALPLFVDDARLITPSFTATNDAILQYWIRADSPDISYADALFKVEITTNGINWTDLKSYSQDIFTSSFIPKGISLESYAGQNVQIAFRVQDNSFGSGILIDDVLITGNSNPAYSWLSLDGGFTLDETIPAGTPNVQKQIGFDSSGLIDGSYYADIFIISNDSSYPISYIDVVLNVGNYSLSITPTSLDFGELEVGNTDVIPFSIENTGSLGIEGEVIVPDGFTVYEIAPTEEKIKTEKSRENIYFYIMPGGTTDFEVIFAPTSAIDYTGDIAVFYDSGNQNETISVSGSGTQLPTVIATAISNITYNSALIGGNVADDGNTTVTVRGVCWSTTENPTISDDHTIDGSGSGTYTSNMTDLLPDTHYFLKAYATNYLGTAYSNQLEFITLPEIPPATPANLTIEVSGQNIILTWDAVSGADSYKVYSSDDPELDYGNWTLEQENITDTNWSETISENRKFYYVKAIKD